jgi:hypothetical protein
LHGNVLSDEAKFLHGAQTTGGNGHHHGSGHGDLTQALGGQLTDDLTNLGNWANMSKHGDDTAGPGFQTTQEFIGSSGALANPDNQHDLKNHALNHMLPEK